MRIPPRTLLAALATPVVQDVASFLAMAGFLGTAVFWLSVLA